jgi:thiol-disulfide isomerase/thioredoxin
MNQRLDSKMTQNKYSREEVLSVAEMREKYDTAYPEYVPDPEILGELKSLLNDIKIIIVLGTWCSDSRVHVSHFYKIADEMEIDQNSISLICVDETKRAENGWTDHLSIVSVPTFIFMKNDKEIGRIIEAPKNTLERDMVELLTKK